MEAVLSKVLHEISLDIPNQCLLEELLENTQQDYKKYIN